MKEHVLYLKDKEQSDIFHNFCNQCIEKVDNTDKNLSISWKNMHYIWKIYISNCSFPNMIYSNTLKALLKETYEYNEENDSFLNITSKHLPHVSAFIHFWDENIVVDMNEDLEIDELCNLYKKWNQNSSGSGISEHELLKILHHYFPNVVEIVENKFIQHISCNLWNKTEDIEAALNDMKQKYKFSEEQTIIAFDELYNFYCKYCNKNNKKMIVSKHYFEKYLYSSELSNYIEFDNFISKNWFLSTNLII